MERNCHEAKSELFFCFHVSFLSLILTSVNQEIFSVYVKNNFHIIIIITYSIFTRMKKWSIIQQEKSCNAETNKLSISWFDVFIIQLPFVTLELKFLGGEISEGSHYICYIWVFPLGCLKLWIFYTQPVWKCVPSNLSLVTSSERVPSDLSCSESAYKRMHMLIILIMA